MILEKAPRFVAVAGVFLTLSCSGTPVDSRPAQPAPIAPAPERPTPTQVLKPTQSPIPFGKGEIIPTFHDSADRFDIKKLFKGDPNQFQIIGRWSHSDKSRDDGEAFIIGRGCVITFKRDYYRTHPVRDVILQNGATCLRDVQ